MWLEKAAAQEGEGSEAFYYAQRLTNHLALSKRNPAFEGLAEFEW